MKFHELISFPTKIRIIPFGNVQRTENGLQQIPPIEILNQQWAKTDTFSVNSQNNNLNLPEISAINDEPIPDIAVEEKIKDFSDNLKLKKSAGVDLITAEIRKQLPYKTILQLTKFF